jgi:hypothetical protein
MRIIKKLKWPVSLVITCFAFCSLAGENDWIRCQTIDVAAVSQGVLETKDEIFFNFSSTVGVEEREDGTKLRVASAERVMPRGKYKVGFQWNEDEGFSSVYILDVKTGLIASGPNSGKSASVELKNEDERVFVMTQCNYIDAEIFCKRNPQAFMCEDWDNADDGEESGSNQ